MRPALHVKILALQGRSANFVRMKKIFFAIIPMLFLAACNDSFGPVSADLKVNAPISLRYDGSDASFAIPAGDNLIPVTAKFSGGKVSLTFDNGQKAVFKNAKFNKDANTVTSTPESSGQLYGLTIRQSVVCNPNCETVQRYRDVQSCTRWESRPVTYCSHTPSGAVYCETHYEQVGIPGRVDVETTVITRNYAYAGQLFDGNTSHLADLSGNETRSTTSVRDLGPCW